MTDEEHVLELLKGTVSVGNAPREMLAGDQFPTLLIAVAYAGSGGTLLLAQSLWLRDKGFGMARYQGRIAGIRGENEEIVDTGIVFDPETDRTMLERFRAWMRTAEQELLVTFVLLILLLLQPMYCTMGGMSSAVHVKSPAMRQPLLAIGLLLQQT